MKFILLVVISVFVHSDPIEDLNNNPKSTWKAKRYPPEVLNLNAIRGKLIHPWVAHVKNTSCNKFFSTAPDSFDARDQWPGIMVSVDEWPSPQDCASFYALAAVETMSDRVGIINNAKTVYSLRDVIFCDTNNYGCDGGYGDMTWQYILKTGLALDSCIPYTNTSCPKTCADGTPISRKTASSVYTVGAGSMQSELQTNGPFTVTFDVYGDFFSYESGVYQHQWGGLEGGLEALVLGWGVSEGIPYWTIQMGFGADFGMNGYVWILRGSDECGIEDNGNAALF